MVEHHATNKSTGKTLVIVGLIILLLLAWRWLRNKTGDTNNVTNKSGDIDLGGITSPIYTLPGLISPPGAFDWIHACDLGCTCGPAKAHGFESAEIDPLVLPVLVYINVPNNLPPSSAGQLPPAPQFNFPSYTAPPLPTWWYEAGYNVHHEPNTTIMTSTGIVGILGKYSRSGWPDGRSFPQQTKDVVLDGDDAYVNGKHYKHDKSKDNPNRPPRPQDYGSAGGAFARG